MALPAPQSKPLAPASRLVARVALLVAFGLGLGILAAGPAPQSTVLLFRGLNADPKDFVAIATIIAAPVAAQVGMLCAKLNRLSGSYARLTLVRRLRFAP
jgi:membrane protein DedA with SNARE-associated domain